MVVTRELTVTTRGRGFVELTHELNGVVRDSGLRIVLWALCVDVDGLRYLIA